MADLQGLSGGRTSGGPLHLARCVAVGLFAVALLTAPARAHEEGTEEFPCDQGPFGVPGLQDPPDQIGQWSAVVGTFEQATHVTVLHTGKVLWWRGDSDNGEQATTYVWDPVTTDLDSQLTPDDNIFCSGHLTLADGRVLVLGGNVHPNFAAGLPDTNLFNPYTETWTKGSDSTYARWYPTLTPLADGRVLAISGRIQKSPLLYATIPEIYDPGADTWTELPGADLSLGVYRPTFLLPNGLIVIHEGDGTTRTLDIETETWQTIGTSNFAGAKGSYAMYRPGKILKMGGGFVGTNTAEVLDMTEPAPAWRAVDPMTYPRRRSDLVILPDGRLLGVGGSVEGNSSPECAMHATEVWDPATESWTTWASTARPRIYHSTAVLLPDGRVLAAGGENSHVTVGEGGETNMEIFSPPYLFQGPRPEIDEAPEYVGLARPFIVETPDAASIQSVALLRPSSVTHNTDHNQLYVPLTFTAEPGILRVDGPEHGNVAPSGYYMLFLVNASGVPSEAAFVKLGNRPLWQVPALLPLGGGLLAFLLGLLGVRTLRA